MNTFNYRKYLLAHGWSGNPFGTDITLTNYLDPANPFFLDWCPTKYISGLLLPFFTDTNIFDTIVMLHSASYSYQRTYLNFWFPAMDSVRSYAANLGKDIYVARNGFFNPSYEDYLLVPLGAHPIFPVYNAPSLEDSNKVLLDGFQARINIWRMLKEYTVNSMGQDVPLVAFCDFADHLPFAHLGGINEPADQREIYLRTYPMEMRVAGVNFCYPVVESEEIAWLNLTSNGTALIDVIKQQADFLNAYYHIYRNVIVSDNETLITVNGIVPFNGEWNYTFGRIDSPVNDSKVTIAYMDADDGTKSYLHIINHNWDSLAYQMIPQDSIPMEIPIRDSCIMVRVISPDFAGEDTLSFTYQDSVVSCTIPNLAYYDVLILDLFSTDVEENAPIRTTLFYQNHPNPFTKATTIRYSIGHPCLTQLKIYNLAGQMVKMLVNKRQKVGSYSVVWDSKDNNNKLISSGLYFIKLIADDFQQTKKLLLLR